MNWWLGEISENDKRLIKLGEKLDEWERMLIRRFRESVNITMDLILKEKYTLRDVN